jgi:hypothetical protein
MKTPRSFTEALMQAFAETGDEDIARSLAKIGRDETTAHEPRRWHNTEPGVLVLTGTRWRIHYRPSQRRPDYELYDDQRPIIGSEWLAPLKQFAIDRQAELDELDAG